MYNVLVIGMWTGPDDIKRSMHTATPRVENSRPGFLLMAKVCPRCKGQAIALWDKHFLICLSENFYFTNFHFCSYFLERRVESRQTCSNHENAEFTDHFFIEVILPKNFSTFYSADFANQWVLNKDPYCFAQMEIYLVAPVSHLAAWAAPQCTQPPRVC